VHLCIVIFTTLQICSMTETTGAYSRNLTNLFFHKFLCTGVECSDNVYYLFIEDFRILIIMKTLDICAIFSQEMIFVKLCKNLYTITRTYLQIPR